MPLSGVSSRIVGFWEEQVLELIGSIDTLLQHYPPQSPGPTPPLSTPGPAHPDPAAFAEWSGPAAAAVKHITDEAFSQHAACLAADQHLAAAVAEAHALSGRVATQLRTLRAEIPVGVRARLPSLDAPGGRIEMARFLDGKAGELRTLIRQTQEQSTDHAANIAALNTAVYSV